jgi:hypothetical protein
MRILMAVVAVTLGVCGADAAAQAAGQTAPAPAGAQQQPQPRPLSPPGSATAMVAGEWVKNDQGNLTYQGGKWIEVIYSRPMLRQRDDIFGSGADYGSTVNAGAPVWRVGANQTTVFKTEAPLVFAGKPLPAGEYSMFVELKSPTDWTLIFSTWPRQAAFNPDDKTALYGSAGYTPDRDVLRATMSVDSKRASRIDQLTIYFSDVTKDSGKLVIAWDRTAATAEFKVALR